jgi:hypothetical protein
MNKEVKSLNPSIAVQDIEKNLGASIQILELSPSDIMDIIMRDTLPTFSKYYPLFTKCTIDPERDKVPERVATFYIRSDLGVLGVSKLLVENYFGSQGLPVVTPYFTNPVDRQIISDVTSMYYQPFTFDFEPPNIVTLFPKTYFYGKFMIEIKCIHPAHLATIPLSMKDEFLELALYDVRAALYPIRDRFKNINTNFGSVELFMDKLENAADDRKTLIEKFRANFGKSSKRRKMFIG